MHASKHCFCHGELKAYAWSNGVYSFWLCWVSQQKVETCKQTWADAHKHGCRNCKLMNWLHVDSQLVASYCHLSWMLLILVLPLGRFPFPRMQCFQLCSLYQTQPHTWNCNDSEKVVTALPKEEFAHNSQPRKFCNFSVKPRGRPVNQDGAP